MCIPGWLWVYFVSGDDFVLLILLHPLPGEGGSPHACLTCSCSVSLDSSALASAKSVTLVLCMLRQARHQRTTAGTPAHSPRSCEWMAHSSLVGLAMAGWSSLGRDSSLSPFCEEMLLCNSWLMGNFYCMSSSDLILGL